MCIWPAGLHAWQHIGVLDESARAAFASASRRAIRNARASCWLEFFAPYIKKDSLTLSRASSGRFMLR